MHIELLVFWAGCRGQVKIFKQATSKFTSHKPKEKGKRMQVRLGRRKDELSPVPSPVSKASCMPGIGWEGVAQSGRKDVGSWAQTLAHCLLPHDQ